MNETRRFFCTQCSRCCRYEEGFVFLSPRDVRRLARYLRIKSDQMITRFCRWVPMGGVEQLSLQEERNRDCIFWNDGGCSVYKARPLQCRTYPFWQHIVAEDGGWEREAAVCPGIGIGPLWREKTIDRLVRSRSGELAVVRGPRSAGEIPR